MSNDTSQALAAVTQKFAPTTIKMAPVAKIGPQGYKLWKRVFHGDKLYVVPEPIAVAFVHDRFASFDPTPVDDVPVENYFFSVADVQGFFGVLVNEQARRRLSKSETGISASLEIEQGTLVAHAPGE